MAPRQTRPPGTPDSDQAHHAERDAGHLRDHRDDRRETADGGGEGVGVGVRRHQPLPKRRLASRDRSSEGRDGRGHRLGDDRQRAR